MPNSTTIIPFILNRAPPHDQAPDVPDSESFWACRIVAAFQPSTGSDGDPNSERATWGQYYDGDAFIYMESIREDNRSMLSSANPTTNQMGQTMMLELRNAVVAHEVGHGPANDIWCPIWNGPPINSLDSPDHVEGGLMANGLIEGRDQEFKAMTIYRFRKVEKWSN